MRAWSTIHSVHIPRIGVYTGQLVTECNHLLMLGALWTRLRRWSSTSGLQLGVHLLLLSISEMVWEASLLLRTLLLLDQRTRGKIGCSTQVLSRIAILRSLTSISLRICLIALQLLHLGLLILAVLELILIHPRVCMDRALILVMYRFWTYTTPWVWPTWTWARVLRWCIQATMSLTCNPLVLVYYRSWLALVGPRWATSRSSGNFGSHSWSISTPTWNLLLCTTALSHWRIAVPLHSLHLLRS